MAELLPKSTALHLSLAVALLFAGSPLRAQTSDPKALAAVRSAVASELQKDAADHNNWTYRDRDIEGGQDNIYLVVGYPGGEMRRLIQRDGKPVSPAIEQAETQRIEQFIRDAADQAKTRKSASHDEDQATQLLQMLPDAFIWTIVSETPQFLTLKYVPNPNFSGPNMEARVMSTMAGELVIARNGDRIKTLRGALTEDFRFAFGLLGRLNKGGTFQIERREVAPGLWEIAETHVHIGGHAFFKTIGSQQDEVKTDWKPSPAKNLQDVARLLKAEH